MADGNFFDVLGDGKKKGKKKAERQNGVNGVVGVVGSSEADESPAVVSSGLGPTLPGAWRTSRPKAVMRKERKEMNADEAVAEIELQIASPGWENPVHRSSLLRQWRRMMEEGDTVAKYVDEKNDNLTFADVFVKSRGLEAIVASALRQPLFDDNVLAHIFSHCMEGDFKFFKRLSDGLKLVSMVFKDIHQEVPPQIVDNFCGIISAIKVSPRGQRERLEQLKKIDAEIAYHFQRLDAAASGGAGGGKDGNIPSGSSGRGVDERNSRTAELLRLAVKKQEILQGDQDRARNVDVIQPLLDETVEQINSLVQFGVLQRDAALEKVKEFETNRSHAMKGQDTSITSVIEKKEAFDREEANLKDQLRDLERQVEAVKTQIQRVQNQRREHSKEYSKVMGVYQEWLGTFHGEDESVRTAFQYAEAALTKRHEARDFTIQLGTEVKEMLCGKSSRLEQQKQVATKQFLNFLDTHLGSLKDTMDLVARRVKFCNGKLQTMKAELREAQELRMSDVAADLAAGISKFEQMHRDARAQMQRTADDVSHIQAVLETFTSSDEDDLAMTALRARAHAALAEISRARDELAEA